MGGVKFWCYNAGHVLGAAMFMIEIAGVKVAFPYLYYSRSSLILLVCYDIIATMLVYLCFFMLVIFTTDFVHR